MAAAKHLETFASNGLQQEVVQPNLQNVLDEIYCSDEELVDDVMEMPSLKSTEMDQTSMFCNKYETDMNLPTVANKLASIIINFESNKQINEAIEDDFEQEFNQVDLNDEIYFSDLEDEITSETVGKRKEQDLNDEIYQSDMDEEECSPQPPECPSLQDLNAMSKSETPLSFARTLFDKCSTYVNSSIIILRSKDLHILNEVCLKLKLKLKQLTLFVSQQMTANH